MPEQTTRKERAIGAKRANEAPRRITAPDSDSLVYNYRYEDKEAHWFHAHRGIEMLYIYSGSGEIMAENRVYPIRDHMLVCFQPYQLHRVAVPAAPGRSYIRTNLTFDPERLDVYLAPFPSLSAFFRSLHRHGAAQQVFYDMRQTDVPGILEELSGVLTLSGVGPDEHAEEQAGLLLLRLLRAMQQQATIKADSPEPRLRGEQHGEKIERWLDRHYKEPFRLERLADELHLSPYHVSHVFKAYAGITLTDYLIRRRVREACVLLANTDRPVRRIAAEIGGLSPSYFSQMFRRIKGMTPEEYRSSIR
ncbi:hypothetical protein CDO73_17705 [Saccharibacillus sp. O23]|uniref:helix-turn-helix transcriptional regulator n=1 Tax=Saccharibacillus sp. O23 TaxID=2009338 RepID=UPI000B4E6DB2|nr:AraC family transcriptional regulator [Saccharibacillus sp. O23]OWR28733.1 hypothetical protein CDO73_17705 [Saccharibacillus sp. O23]